MTQSKYRCETCESCDRETGLWWYCNEADISLNPIFDVNTIEKVGCASHSDSTDQREKVLEALDILIKTESWDAMKSFIAELRKGDEP